MVVTVDELPKEIWIEISKSLEYNDLLRLRLCSKMMNEMVASKAIWRPRCHERWLNQEREDILNFEPEASNLVKQQDDWFYYFRYRNRIDKHVVNTLMSMKDTQDQKLYWDKFNYLFKYGTKVIPLLSRLEVEGYNQGTPFEITYMAHRLLVTMRHKHVFELINRSLDDDSEEWVHYAEESIFLPLAALDVCFNRLLPYRKKMIEQIHAQIKKDYEDLTDFLTLPSTLRLDKLMKYLFQILAKYQLPHVRQRARYFLDDFMLLRIYAGESKGHPLLLLAIVQSVATRYNIETVLCEEFLIVRDPGLRNGESYVTISQGGKPRIFSRKNLIDSMCRIFPSREVVLNSVIPRLLQPLKTNSLLFKVFDEWYPYCKKSIWKMIPDKTIQALLTYMPHSRYPVQVSDYEYIQAYWKLSQSANHRALWNIGKANFLKFVLNQFPHDLVLLKDTKGFEQNFSEDATPVSFDEIFSEKYLICPGKTDMVGQFVSDRRNSQLFIVVAVKEAQNATTYFILMDCLGHMNVLLKDDTEVVEVDTLELETIEEFLDLLSLSDLGLFFTRFDHSAGHLVPSKKFDSYLRRTTEAQ
ncbi:LAFE_0E07008g1_1 [Lachancea fermentati]|uniref:LAFE_0E07008g1_1 n=1 Tax=Lachancea fermentati TaxID=4955 RepID=A0A1G4MD29_LACFM|nr:LAFE_0E07008g1_1 [Lachancea fermentati]